ncbi:TIGR03085 family protein [Nocardia stercoris]|uniref:TIGR03085 family protein n=2 Tax=Nocardia stercoris TaxID=2483361 RepID=A0A3M2KVY6_9NOCA|nr:TIGR03085 family protein [Nocardia stercoris]
MAQRERRSLAAAMTEIGPDARTLCGDWTVRDLAAHLVVRERRPDAAPGILVPAFAGYLDRVQAKVVRQPFEELVELVRTGPPWWSPLRPVDAVANLTEMFVHHEDVRRAGSGWEPRELTDADQEHLWRALGRAARLAYRKSPVGVVLVDPRGRRLTARGGEPEVVLTGAPAELLLHAFGRDEVRIEADGDPEAVAAVLSSDRSF